MPPLGDCLRPTPQAAAIVDDYVEKTQNTNKTTTVHFDHLLFVRILTPKWTLYSAHRCNKLRLNVRCQDWSWCLDIKGCQGTKRKKVIKQSQSSLIKKAGAYVRHQKAIRIKHAFFCNWLCFIFY
jgi:hypothetical protein